MFKNLIPYRFSGVTLDATALAETLDASKFTPCEPSQAVSGGWVAPRGVEHSTLVEVVDGELICTYQIERKVVPSNEVSKRVDQRAKKFEEETGRKPGKKTKTELKEQVIQEMLPQAFSKIAKVNVWLSPKDGLLAIDVSSEARAEEVVSVLAKVINGMAIRLVQTKESPAVCMAAWLMDGVMPEGFSIDNEGELKTTDELKSVVKFKRHQMDNDNVREYLKSGMAPTKLAVSYKDRVSMLLTDGMHIKRINFLDLVFEGQSQKEDAFDADIAIATGELGPMIKALIYGLGGEAEVPSYKEGEHAEDDQANKAKQAEKAEAVAA